MEKHHRRFIVLILLAFLISTACSIGSRTVSTAPGFPETAAAETWSAMQTSAFLAATSTFTPLPYTDTPIATATPTITNSPTPTHTLIPVLTQRPTNTPSMTPTRTVIPTVTRIPIGGGGGGGGGSGGGGGGGGGGSTTRCYAAELVRHVTIPNNQILPPNTPFTKIWRIKNVGTCTWPSDARMVPANNNLWAGDASQTGKRLGPGDSADFKVDLISPTSNGTFTGDWLVRIDKDTRIGPRGQDQDAFRVRINVSSSPPTVLWNFVDNFCAARWRTHNNRTVSCPSGPNSSSAFVLRSAPATIEDGSTRPAVIWSQPATSEDASIDGTFPGLYISGIERFRASAGCVYSYDRCHVRLDIYYRLLDGNDVLLASQDEDYDGVAHTLIDNFNLAPFANNYVTFTFKVTAINDNEPAAAWFYVEMYH